MRRALLLDLDGTLADSLGILRDCYERCAAIYGRQPSSAEFDTINGPPLPEIARRLSQRWNLDAEYPGLLQTYEALIDEAYGRVEPASGALKVLTHARRRGWATGVVTSNNRLRTHGWLSRVALIDMLDVVVTREDVRDGKPAPDAYALALRRLGAGAAASVAVEDSLQGVAAALSARITTLAIDPEASVAWPEGVCSLRHLADVAAFI